MFPAFPMSFYNTFRFSPYIIIFPAVTASFYNTFSFPFNRNTLYIYINISPAFYICVCLFTLLRFASIGLMDYLLYTFSSFVSYIGEVICDS